MNRATGIDRLREIAERYLRDDEDGDLDSEKWGLAMAPGDVVWLLAENERLRERRAQDLTGFERIVLQSHRDRIDGDPLTDRAVIAALDRLLGGRK